jgi:serine/threonine protein phosphatase PrpC
MSAALYYRAYGFHFMVVADGHGGADYTRSDVGSFLAAQAASESVNRFIIFVIDVFEHYPETWVELVKEDFAARFGKMLVNNWVRMVEAHARDTAAGNPAETIKRYGTTVSLALVFQKYLFAGRIGDSSVYTLFNDGKKNGKKQAAPLFDEEQAEGGSLGLATPSLCSKDAFRKWQARSLALEGVVMALLATDGFADSLKEPAAVITDFHRRIERKGAAAFERDLPGILRDISEKGVGDDISLALFLSE